MLTKTQQADRTELGNYADPNSNYPDNLPKSFTRMAELHIPTGEITRGDLVSFCLALKMKHNGHRLEPIAEADRFNAQGLEGKIVIPAPYFDLLVLSDVLTPYRFAIK